MIRALGFELVCDRCQEHSHDTPQGAPDKATARREAKAQGWGKRWQRRRLVMGRAERGHFEDLCPNCLPAPASQRPAG